MTRAKTSKWRLVLGAVPMLVVLGGVLGLALLTGPRLSARSAFEHDYACTQSGIDIRRRADLKHHDLFPDSRRDAASGAYGDRSIYEAQGCGHKTWYSCTPKPLCEEARHYAGK